MPSSTRNVSDDDVDIEIVLQRTMGRTKISLIKLLYFYFVVPEMSKIVN